ncbi:MAG TPA: hypothetical protein VMU83_07580 [Hanamia sp.]|nr:hypothetical protein [Hanamia sp.]
MKKFKILFYLMLLICLSCKSQNTGNQKSKDSSEANLLNAEAMKTFELTCNKDSIEKSIKLLERAIKLDSTDPFLYGNEAVMLCSLKKYQDAIKVLNRYLYSFPINLSMETFKGFIFEYTDNIDSAMALYSNAISHYDVKIESDSNNLPVLLDRALLLLFSKSKSEGKMEYDRIVNKFPNDESVKFLKDDFYSFDRKTYLRQIFSKCN